MVRLSALPSDRSAFRSQNLNSSFTTAFFKNAQFVRIEAGRRMTTGTEMARSLRFIFQFPPINGAFDAGYGIVYIFGQLYEGEIENIIVHETLHYVLLRVAGKKASLKLDKIYAQLDD